MNYDQVRLCPLLERETYLMLFPAPPSYFRLIQSTRDDICTTLFLKYNASRYELLFITYLIKNILFSAISRNLIFIRSRSTK